MVMGHIAPLDFMQMRTGFETGDEAGLSFFFFFSWLVKYYLIGAVWEAICISFLQAEPESIEFSLCG